MVMSLYYSLTLTPSNKVLPFVPSTTTRPISCCLGADVTQQTHSNWRYPLLFCSNCRLWLIAWPFFQRNLFFLLKRQSLPFLRHLLLILSCLIRDQGGSSRSSGCEDDKWIARLEKWTQIHPLLEFVFTSMHCSSSRIMDGMGGILKVQHRIPINS